MGRNIFQVIIVLNLALIFILVINIVIELAMFQR